MYISVLFAYTQSTFHPLCLPLLTEIIYNMSEGGTFIFDVAALSLMLCVALERGCVRALSFCNDLEGSKIWPSKYGFVVVGKMRRRSLGVRPVQTKPCIWTRILNFTTDVRCRETNSTENFLGTFFSRCKFSIGIFFFAPPWYKYIWKLIEPLHVVSTIFWIERLAWNRWIYYYIYVIFIFVVKLLNMHSCCSFENTWRHVIFAITRNYLSRTCTAHGVFAWILLGYS